jgi:pyruvate dehydrogenase E1 component beta subunit
MRPIVEIMTVNFSLLAADQILNNAATLLHMSGGQINVPLVIRMATGGGRQLAAQHSHSLENWYAHIPGIRVLYAATHEDARGMLWPALQDPDPVIIFENPGIYNLEADLPAELQAVDIDHARILRPGSDVTIIAFGASIYRALEAAEILVSDGIEAEVIDLHTLRPLDERHSRNPLRALIVRSSWTRDGAAAVCRQRSARESWRRTFTSSTRR